MACATDINLPFLILGMQSHAIDQLPKPIHLDPRRIKK